PQNGAAALVVEEVEQREGQVAPVGMQGKGGQSAGFLNVTRIGGPRRQFAQQSKLALANYAPRVVGVGADDPAGAALVIGHRAVRERVVGFLWVPVALHDQQQCFV